MIELRIQTPDGTTDRVTFDRDELTIGRARINDLVLDHASVQNFHACLVRRQYKYVLRFEDPYKLEVAEGEFAIGAYRLTLVPLPVETYGHEIDAVEDGLIRSIETLRDDASREVYADWLEERGQLVRAEFLRLELAMRGSKAGHERDQAFVRLRELASAIAPGWRVRLACPVVQCRKPACPRHWGALVPTEDVAVRRCETCDGDVRYCWTKEEVVVRGRELIVMDIAVRNVIPHWDWW